MSQETKENQSEAFERAAGALLDLLLRLEKDGHIRTAEKEEKLSAVLLPELMAYAAAVLKRDTEAMLRLPGAYLALDRFDAMAGAYDDAFYNRMQVAHPGRLTDYYIELLTAYLTIKNAEAEKTDALNAAELKTALDHLRAAQTATAF